MNDRLQRNFGVFLVLWTGAMLAHFTYVQSATDWGAKELDWNPANLWHPFWFGVVNATLVLVPFLLFQVPVARRYGSWSSAVGRAIIAYGIGTVLWGMGNLYWFLKNVGGDDAPYPSLADAGYLAVLPFAAWALWELTKVVGLRSSDWKWLPVALLVAFPLNAYIMLPQGIGAGTFETPLSTAISTTYILSDVVLLGVAILVALGARRAAGGRFFAPVLAVAASIMLLYVGDLVFNYRIANETFYNAEISDLLYGAFILASSFATYLFLVADVRAAAAVADEAQAWRPEDDAARAGADDGPLLPPLVEIPTAILTGQVRVMGERTAVEIARSVPGIEVDEESGMASAVDIVALDAMIREYRSIAGPLGEMACWTAARSVLARHEDFVVPSLERFQGPVVSGTPSSSRQTTFA